MLPIRSLRFPLRAAAPRCLAAAAGLVLTFGLAAPAWSQGGIVRVKNLYANASYEEALRELALVQPEAPLTRVTDAAAYEVFCLVALGREQEAADAISEIVRVDPLYHPPETEVAPRIIAFFDKVRRPLLPAIVRELYASAKSRLEQKEPAAAKQELDLVVSLLDEIGTAEDADLADLRTLAIGFRDLAAINAARAAAPPPSPPPAPTPAPAPAPPPVAPPPPPPPAEPVIYSTDDADVTPPVVVSRTLPPWRATTPVEKLQTFRGQLEIVIDETGAVVSSRMLRELRPDYDPQLLKSVPGWKFRPATRDGKPVRYRYVMELELDGGRD